ncbi:MAG: lysophospholipid acyltransferase family protein [Patescibacteria group bacterium]|nr:lysophospholipid acyltransferase family protein [Patescibacteria group bacterium]
MLLPIFRNKFNSINGIENIPQKGPYIIASNHIDFLDGFYVCFGFYMINKHLIYFLSKTKNYWWTKATLPIDPKNKLQSIETAVKYLKRGKTICNFIEGKRNYKKYLLRGKTGSVRMAIKAQIPIIPIGIKGPMEKTFMRSVKKMLTSNNQVTINIGEAITFKKYYGQDLNKKTFHKLTDEVMQKISPLCQKTYSF